MWNGRPNIQVLTTGIPLHFHSTDIKLQKTTARCISAFATAIRSLKAHYDEPLYHQTPMVDHVYPFVCNIFPYPVTFTSDTSELPKKIIYHSLVKSGKLIFRGEISDTHEKICIKFVQCYSAEVHKFCASINCYDFVRVWLIQLNTFIQSFISFELFRCLSKQVWSQRFYKTELMYKYIRSPFIY